MVIKLTLDAFTAEKLLVTKPRSLPTATFCALLIEQALDTPATLAERTEGSEASNSSSSNKEDISKTHIYTVGKSRKSREKPDYSDGFLAFWNEYQRAPMLIETLLTSLVEPSLPVSLDEFMGIERHFTVQYLYISP